MKYKITVEKERDVNERDFEMAFLCIVDSLSLICPQANGEVVSDCQFIIDIELEACDDVRDSMRVLFQDASSELYLKGIEKIV